MCALNHGSKLTFGGKKGVQLISLQQEGKNRKQLISLVIVITVLLSGSGIAWLLLSRFQIG